MSDVKTGRRAMYAELTRTAVLDAAKALFVTKGFAATSIDDIARSSESSKGAVYHHFSDKQQIFTEVFRASQQSVMQAAFAVLSPSGTAWERAQAVTRAFLHAYVADADARALLRQVMGALGWDRVREIDEELALPFIRGLLEEAIRDGEVADVPIEATADLLFSLYCNAVLFIAAAENPDVAAGEVATVVFKMLEGMKNRP
ncbi:MAG TPA: TetR/AcrR family transcriptional regulator [Mycobacterium sp.]|jgi:AcrR family transcriptional regulator